MGLLLEDGSPLLLETGKLFLLEWESELSSILRLHRRPAFVDTSNVLTAQVSRRLPAVRGNNDGNH